MLIPHCRALLLPGQGVYAVTGLCTKGLKRSSCRGPIYGSMGSGMCGRLLRLCTNNVFESRPGLAYFFFGFLHNARLGLLVAAQVVLSSTAFAACHLAAPLQDVLLLWVLGCALGAVAAASGGSLVAATLAHALYNCAVLAGVLL